MYIFAPASEKIFIRLQGQVDPNDHKMEKVNQKYKSWKFLSKQLSRAKAIIKTIKTKPVQ